MAYVLLELFAVFTSWHYRLRLAICAFHRLNFDALTISVDRRCPMWGCFVRTFCRVGNDANASLSRKFIV